MNPQRHLQTSAQVKPRNNDSAAMVANPERSRTMPRTLRKCPVPSSLPMVVMALVAVLCSATPTPAGVFWDGTGNPVTAGFFFNVGGEPGGSYLLDTPNVGEMRGATGGASIDNFRHTGPGLDLDNSVGWFVETRWRLFQTTTSQNNDDAFPASLF